MDSTYSAVTNALFASVPQAWRSPRFPCDDACSASQKSRSSQAAIDWPQQRRASVCGSAAALRSGYVPAVSPPALHFPRSPPADRSLNGIFHLWALTFCRDAA